VKFLVILSLLVTLLVATVDINSANVKELTTLKGIGPKKAESLLNYRKSHCFKTVDEIVKVKGIGKKTLEKNRKNLRVGVCQR